MASAYVADKRQYYILRSRCEFTAAFEVKINKSKGDVTLKAVNMKDKIDIELGTILRAREFQLHQARDAVHVELLISADQVKKQSSFVQKNWKKLRQWHLPLPINQIGDDLDKSSRHLAVPIDAEFAKFLIAVPLNAVRLELSKDVNLLSLVHSIPEANGGPANAPIVYIRNAAQGVNIYKFAIRKFSRKSEELDMDVCTINAYPVQSSGDSNTVLSLTIADVILPPGLSKTVPAVPTDTRQRFEETYESITSTAKQPRDLGDSNADVYDNLDDPLTQAGDSEASAEIYDRPGSVYQNMPGDSSEYANCSNSSTSFSDVSIATQRSGATNQNTQPAIGRPLSGTSLPASTSAQKEKVAYTSQKSAIEQSTVEITDHTRRKTSAPATVQEKVIQEIEPPGAAPADVASPVNHFAAPETHIATPKTHSAAPEPGTNFAAPETTFAAPESRVAALRAQFTAPETSTAAPRISPAAPKPRTNSVAPGPGANPAAFEPGTNPAAFGPGVNPAAFGPGTNPAAFGPGNNQAAFGPGVNPAAFGPGNNQAAFGPGNGQAAFGPGVNPAAFGPGNNQAAFGPGNNQAAFGPGVNPAAFGPGNNQAAFGPGNNQAAFGPRANPAELGPGINSSAPKTKPAAPGPGTSSAAPKTNPAAPGPGTHVAAAQAVAPKSLNAVKAPQAVHRCAEEANQHQQRAPTLQMPAAQEAAHRNLRFCRECIPYGLDDVEIIQLNLDIKDRVLWFVDNQEQPEQGTLAWLGHLLCDSNQHNTTGVIACVECDRPIGGDPTINGNPVAETKPRHAVFLPLAGLSLAQSYFGSEVTKTKVVATENEETENVCGPLHRPIDVRSLAQLIGRKRGIQGDHNSCYLDTVLFTFFSFTSAFDHFLDSRNSNNNKDNVDFARGAPMKLQNLIRESIVNPLRKNLYVSASKTMVLRRNLEATGFMAGATTEEKDPEEFIKTLFERLLQTQPFLKLNSGEAESVLQVFVTNTDAVLKYKDFQPNQKANGQPRLADYDFVSLQRLVTVSFLENRIRLAEVPRCLLLQLPRSGKNVQLFDRTLPEMTLNISSLVDRVPRGCAVCPSLAELECSECLLEGFMDDENFAFCRTCCDRIHARRPNHQPSALKDFAEYAPMCNLQASLLGRCSPADATLAWREQNFEDSLAYAEELLQLYAVICIERSHYVTFVRTDMRNPEAEWVMFNSMADRVEPRGNQGFNGYNIPEVIRLPKLSGVLRELGELLRRRTHLVKSKEFDVLSEAAMHELQTVTNRCAELLKDVNVRRLMQDCYLVAYVSADHAFPCTNDLPPFH